MLVLVGPLPQATALVAETVAGSARVLEIASGTGLVSQAIAPGVGELLATDYAWAMVERRECASVVSAVLALVSFPGHRFDLHAALSPSRTPAVRFTPGISCPACSQSASSQRSAAVTHDDRTIPNAKHTVRCLEPNKGARL